LRRAHALRLVLQALRLKHRQPAPGREPLYGACHGAQAAARGPIGLGENEGDLVAGVDDARESSLSELGRTGED
jgi:hypothetical protein